mgnify:CR=1 FL=1
MSLTTDKSEGEEAKSVYSVEEEDDDQDSDHFSRMKPHFIRTPSILNTIIEQIHPDVIAK